MRLTKNFNLSEFNCNDGTKVPEELIPTVQKLANQLQVLRDFIGKPIHINSAYRHEIYNKLIGGSSRSQHILGKAADIRVDGIPTIELHNAIEHLIKEGFMLQGGLGVYNTFVHYDIRKTKARWDYRK